MHISSWVVWDVVSPTKKFHRHSNLALPVTDPALSAVLRSDVMFLGLNPGNVAKAGMATWAVVSHGPEAQRPLHR